MNISDALYAFVRNEIVPSLAAESEFTASLVNGALRAGKKKLAGKLSDSTLMRTFGFTDDAGNIVPETFREFADGMFEGKEAIAVPVVELLKIATGISIDMETFPFAYLLEGNLKLSRQDAEKFISLLTR